MKRTGIALPMVLYVLLALTLLSALALRDATDAWQASAMAADAVRARAAAYRALAETAHPPSVTLLCLRPPHAEMAREFTFADGTVARVAWRSVARGHVLAEVSGRGVDGARHRLLARLRPDSVPVDPWVPGCPAATLLVPEGTGSVGWWVRHPGG